MTDRIAEIRQRLEAITPGQWISAEAGLKFKGQPVEIEYYVTVHDTDTAIASSVLNPHNGEPSKENAAFIASAPANMRYLLDEIERLRELLKEYERFNPFIEDWKDPSMDVYDNLPTPSIKVDPSLPPNSLKIGDTLVTNIGLPNEDNTEINPEDKPRKRHDWFTPKHR